MRHWGLLLLQSSLLGRRLGAHRRSAAFLLLRLGLSQRLRLRWGRA